MYAILSAAAICAVTYYAASLVQFAAHRAFGHRRRIPHLFEVHVSGHHAQYDRLGLLSDRWIPAERHITWFFAVPLAPLAGVAHWLLPLELLAVHLAALGLTVWWHVYLHRHYHLRGSWLLRFRWFHRKRRLHFLHHRRPRRNYAIVEFCWDRLFGTYLSRAARAQGISARDAPGSRRNADRASAPV